MKTYFPSVLGRPGQLLSEKEKKRRGSTDASLALPDCFKHNQQTDDADNHSKKGSHIWQMKPSAILNRVSKPKFIQLKKSKSTTSLQKKEPEQSTKVVKVPSSPTINSHQLGEHLDDAKVHMQEETPKFEISAPSADAKKDVEKFVVLPKTKTPERYYRKLKHL